MKKYLMVVLLIAGVMVNSPGAMAQDVTLMLDWFPNVDHLPVLSPRRRAILTRRGFR